MNTVLVELLILATVSFLCKGELEKFCLSSALSYSSAWDVNLVSISCKGQCPFSLYVSTVLAYTFSAVAGVSVVMLAILLIAIATIKYKGRKQQQEMKLRTSVH